MSGLLLVAMDNQYRLSNKLKKSISMSELSNTVTNTSYASSQKSSSSSKRSKSSSSNSTTFESLVKAQVARTQNQQQVLTQAAIVQAHAQAAAAPQSSKMNKYLTQRQTEIIRYSWFNSVRLPTNGVFHTDTKKGMSEGYFEEEEYFGKITNLSQLLEDRQFWNTYFQELKFNDMETFNKLPQLTDFISDLKLIFKISISSVTDLGNKDYIENLNMVANKYTRIYDVPKEIMIDLFRLVLIQAKEWFGRSFDQVFLVWEKFTYAILQSMFEKDATLVDSKFDDDVRTIDEDSDGADASASSSANMAPVLKTSKVKKFFSFSKQ